MKKGVFAKLISVVLIAVLFSGFASLVFSQEGQDFDITPGGSGSTGSGGDCGNIPESQAIVQYPGDDGFWRACVRGAGEDGCAYPAYSADDEGPMVEGAGIDLENVYEDFGLVSEDGPAPESEIVFIKHVLDPLFFCVEDDEGGSLLFSSHGYNLAGFGYEAARTALEGGTSPGECFTCNNMLDNMEGCFTPDPDHPYYPDQFDWPCAEVDLLYREDCSEMSDMNGPFCEGVNGIGENAGDAVSPVSLPGVSGMGGCYNESPGRLPGRDWFWDENFGYNDDAALGGVFSVFYTPDRFDGFYDYDSVGRCCGNDPEDVGALMAGDSPEKPSFYMCTKNASDGNYVWLPAEDSGNVGVIWTNTLELQDKAYTFDAVSNVKSWFVCNPPDSLEGLYGPNGGFGEGETEGAGPLLEPYDVPPQPDGSPLTWGTTVAEGEGEQGSMVGEDSVPGESSEAAPVDQETFESSIKGVSGGPESNPCDKDGDGYDGFYTREEDRGSPWIVDDECVNPNPQDCDDTLSDDADAFDPDAGSYGRSGIAGMKHPGAVDYCFYDDEGNRLDFNLDCDLETDCIAGSGGKEPDDLEGTIDFENLHKRFMCHQVDEAGAFAECCSYDLGFCINQEKAPGKSRRVGGPINTIQEFSYYPGFDALFENLRGDANIVLRYGVSLIPENLNIEDLLRQSSDFRLGLPMMNYDEPLTNWSGYEYVEFYIWTTTNFIVDIGFGKLKSRGADGDSIDDYVINFRRPVIDYVVNEPGLKKWMHVKIPVDEIYGGEGHPDYFPVDVMVLMTDIRKLDSLDPASVTVDWSGTEKEFSNYIGVDKFFLTPSEDDLEAGLEYAGVSRENYFCSGTWPPVWVSDLDDEHTYDYIGGSESVGKAACNAIPSYKWTGTECCGDDTGDDLIEKDHPELAFKEFYKDDEAACWAGNPITENSRVMLVQYGMHYGFIHDGEDTGIHEDYINRTCFQHDCVFNVPPRQEIYLTNPNPGLYDMYALSLSGRTRVDGGYLPGKVISNIKFEDVPLQVQYREGDFRTCNAAEHILSLEGDEGEPLISENDGDAGEKYRFSSCEGYGMYFCDHADGLDTGWSDEPVMKYPESDSITLEDGTELPWPEDVIPAVNRTTEKRGYNLINNPGFEEV